MAKRVFFSFHYQDVIDFRANVVRHSWVTKPNRETAGYWDASLWEESKRKGDENLKRMIDGGLNGTSVTAVLIGTNTYARRWVKYEIFKSLKRSNTLIGIHINSIPCKNKQTKPHGNNPFEWLAFKFNDQGTRVDPCEWDAQNQRWVWYNDASGWETSTPFPEHAGSLVQVSNWASTYCWVNDNGYQNLGTWVGEDTNVLGV